MIKKIVYTLERIGPWHFVWIAVVISELLTVGFSVLQGYLWWGGPSRNMLTVGAVDALFVPLIVAPVVVYFLQNTARLERLNERLQAEVDERKQAELALAGSEARNRAIIEAYDGLIYICSPDRRIEFMNERLMERTGRDATGEPCYRALHELDAVCPWCVNDRVFAGESVRWEVQSPKDNRWYYVTNSPIYNADGTVSKQAMILDITDRKRLEEELLNAKKLESVGMLAGGVAHDFNNLLAAILGNIELAKMHTVADDSAYERLTEAEQAAYRARDLTSQLLTFAKGGAPVKTVVDLGPVVRQAAELSLRGSNVKPLLSIAADLWAVEADESQVSQVISNLVINAEQATPDGGGVAVGCENVTVGSAQIASLAEGKYVRTTVEDEGIGIGREYLSKIFDPYFTTKKRGSGLGLAIVYSIVKKHNGAVTVESELGKGTRFSVYLPASDRMPAKAPASNAPLPRGEGRVLVMDDDEFIRNSSRNILRTLGYDVELARDGGEAVSVYRAARESGAPFDAVILDLTVPGGMGGKETVRELLAIDPGAKAIVSSGYSSDDVLAEYGRYGFKGAVAKPYRIRELGEALARVIAPE